MTSETLHPAYVIHSRKYRDTSLILELFTQNEGRVAVVARGARSKKKNHSVQPFTPLLVSYVGKGELKTLAKIDAGAMYFIPGDRLLLGMYANELLIRLLGKFEKVTDLFTAYQQLLLSLVGSDDYTVELRRFELKLLNELGYGISFALDAGTGDFVEPDQFYRFVPEQGFRQLSSKTDSSFLGEHLLNVSDGNFCSPEVEQTARRVARIAIARLLGDRPLKSRELFQQLHQERQS